MTSKLTFETDQDDEVIRQLVISAARVGIWFKSCRTIDIEQSIEPHIYSNGYRLGMKELKENVSA